MTYHLSQSTPCHSISGNLYYALTHSPEPLTEEYSYALSWDAATERLEAAGCISVKEAKAMEEIHSSSEAGVEVGIRVNSLVIFCPSHTFYTRYAAKRSICLL